MTHSPDPPAEMLEPLADRDDPQDPGDAIERSDARGYADRDLLPGGAVEVFPPAAG